MSTRCPNYANSIKNLRNFQFNGNSIIENFGVSCLQTWDKHAQLNRRLDRLDKPSLAQPGLNVRSDNMT